MYRKVLFDGRHLVNRYSGLGRYSFKVFTALLKTEREVVLILAEGDIFDSYLNESLTKLRSDFEFKTIYTKYKPFTLANYLFFGASLREYRKYHYFYPHFDLTWFCWGASTFVVHDLFPLVVKDYIIRFSFLKKLAFRFLLYFSLLKKNSRCIAISNSTKSDIVTYYGKKWLSKIKVVYSASTIELPNSDSEAASNRFLFYIGDRRPHKNIPRMISIFSILRSKFDYSGDFIIAGSSKNYRENLDELIEKTSGVRFVGNIADSELVSFFRTSDALFFLSRYEGFGLPILEAAQQGCRVITSNVSAMPEVAPPGSLIVDLETSDEQIAEEIASYLDSKINSNSGFLKQFSWGNTVKHIFGD